MQAIEAEAATSVDPMTLRRVLGHFVTGVTAITAMTDEGPIGITANSFTSVSLDPPLTLFCVSNFSRTRSRFQRAGSFAVNILAEDQEVVSRLFATPGADRFAGVQIRLGQTGSPILHDALAFIDCEIISEIEAGDHLILLGRVIEVGVLREGPPLTFFRGSYQRLALRSGPEDIRP